MLSAQKVKKVVITEENTKDKLEKALKLEKYQEDNTLVSEAEKERIR